MVALEQISRSEELRICSEALAPKMSFDSWAGSEKMKPLCDMGVKNSNFVYLYNVFNFGN